MTLYDIAQQLEFTHLTPDLQLDRTREITSGHVSDLLSDVIANAPGGGVLVTIQVHMNVIAVALHADVEDADKVGVVLHVAAVGFQGGGLAALRVGLLEPPEIDRLEGSMHADAVPNGPDRAVRPFAA